MSAETNRLPRAIFVLPIFALACAVVGVALFYLAQGPAGVRLGRLSDYPPSEQPYRSQMGSSLVYVVNTGADLLVIEPRFTSSNPAWDCTVVWVPTNGRFEDPCSGAKFTLTGAWIVQHGLAADALEHRGLAQYAATVRNGEVWVQPGGLKPGEPDATAAP